MCGKCASVRKKEVFERIGNRLLHARKDAHVNLVCKVRVGVPHHAAAPHARRPGGRRERGERAPQGVEAELLRQPAKFYLDPYFRESTPAFIQDLISSWMTQLENETQVHYANSRAVADVFLPLALQQAERANLDVEDPASEICSAVFQECVSVNTTRDRSASRWRIGKRSRSQR